ncbi:DUF3343 domain-containing protein [Crassaminicella thermophila]|uniref:DUF3343 domain-containing protein n=1 Tax=Crassaminicella thermophila TaxID=2599308 RepID=A0A5C0SB43_CRATE|nr:DUF3343 domain-containing protein [Crassaminicella thermophila]QEK11280.1 DUF3343 domain-containing protein [Crassaminicella thermophila]
MKRTFQTYVLFPSHTDGLALEKVLKSNNMKYTIVPTPRDLSKCCGISILINPDDTKQVEQLLKKHSDIKTEGIYTIEKKKRNWFG